MEGHRTQAPGARRGLHERLVRIARVAAVAGLLLALPLAAGSLAAPRGDPAPGPLMLVFDGAHEPGLGQANPRHAGTFTAAGPACPSGTATDQRYVYPFGVLREHVCDDGSGSFTALLDPTPAEHGGVGRWKILGGTGGYSDLRGRGTFTGELLAGSPSHEETITFRTSWEGLAGFDAVAPRVRDVRTSLRRLGRGGTYLLRVSFRTRDDVPANAVEYGVLPTSGSYALSFAEGRARRGAVSVALVVRPRRPDLPIVVSLRVTDPLGNDRRVLRSVPLPA
ncbi:MAG TPA: hypothetical protein VK926_00645 [Gaiellaceae bacterium]|nr:hypothetical protein [Gaiellaceae bacterium]